MGLDRGLEWGDEPRMEVDSGREKLLCEIALESASEVGREAEVLRLLVSNLIVGTIEGSMEVEELFVGVTPSIFVMNGSCVEVSFESLDVV